MSYQKEVRQFRRRLSEAKSPNEVWWIDKDARDWLRPETYARFSIELASRREKVANAYYDSFHIRRRKHYW